VFESVLLKSSSRKVYAHKFLAQAISVAMATEEENKFL
jgi:hypothetical protein